MMMRRDFVGAIGMAAVGSTFGSLSEVPIPSSGVDEWRTHFPSLSQEINGHPLVYFDTAATSLRPREVIQAVSDFYGHDNANPGGALHTLARRANSALEDARKTVAGFVGAADPLEIVFTRGTTDALNLVAASWGASLKPGDEILIGIAEHASNMLPWQAIAKRTGAELRYFGVRDTGEVDLDDFSAKITVRTKVVAFSYVSNVLGIVNPAREMCARARGSGRIIVVDGAQAVPHFPVNVRELGCDFLAFSSHKMCGPMGVGVLWGRRELLDAMPPYQYGSNMAHDADVDSMHLSDGALKFGAGTPNASGPIGLVAAIRFLQQVGHTELWRHEQYVTREMLRRLAAIRDVRVLGDAPAERRISVFSFTVNGREPADVLKALDNRGIAIRAGDLASLPLLKRLGVTRAARASCYLYSTAAEVESFARVLEGDR